MVPLTGIPVEMSVEVEALSPWSSATFGPAAPPLPRSTGKRPTAIALCAGDASGEPCRVRRRDAARVRCRAAVSPRRVRAFEIRPSTKRGVAEERRSEPLEYGARSHVLQHQQSRGADSSADFASPDAYADQILDEDSPKRTLPSINRQVRGCANSSIAGPMPASIVTESYPLRSVLGCKRILLMTHVNILMYLLLTWFRIGRVRFMRCDEFRVGLAGAGRRTSERRGAAWCDCEWPVVSSMSRSISITSVASLGRFRSRFRVLPEDTRNRQLHRPGQVGDFSRAWFEGCNAAVSVESRIRFARRARPCRQRRRGGQGSGAGQGASGVAMKLGVSGAEAAPTRGRSVTLGSLIARS